MIWNPSIWSWLSSSLKRSAVITTHLHVAHLSASSGAVYGVPGDESRVHTHDHDGSEAPNESPDSILSSDPKPLGKHRPPPPPSILSPGESSYPP
ncbi:hypothetical protein Tco_0462201 [Tanacetum coccineum]